jgi:hypothetical protein
MSDQIDRLARFIMENVEGEPSQNEGAGDTAIRILELEAKLTRYEEALRTISGPADSGPYIDTYREAGGGYRGLQAIALATLDKEEK